MSDPDEMYPIGPAADRGAGSRSRVNPTVVAIGVALGLTFAGLGVAAAQTPSSDATTTTETPAAAPAPAAGADSTTSAPAAGTTPAPAPAPDSSTSGSGSTAAKPARTAETPLTGDTAEKVKAAALAAVPGGTIIRVETDSDGSPYEAHVRKADGTEVEVKVDADFKVTSIEEGKAGGRHEGGGKGGGARETELTGDTAEKVKAAALDAVPGGTIIRVENDGDGSAYEAHVRKPDGTEVEVKVDESFKVTSVEAAPAGGGKRGGQAGHHGRGGDAPATGNSATPTNA